LDSETARLSLSARERLESRIVGTPDWVVIDEVQKVPGLLDEVHRLIEDRRLNFVLTGSSARKLRRGSANLLAKRFVCYGGERESVRDGICILNFEEVLRRLPEIFDVSIERFGGYPRARRRPLRGQELREDNAPELAQVVKVPFDDGRQDCRI
jgi:predicted AAA+ superfamily ATPase